MNSKIELCNFDIHFVVSHTIGKESSKYIYGGQETDFLRFQKNNCNRKNYRLLIFLIFDRRYASATVV